MGSGVGAMEAAGGAAGRLSFKPGWDPSGTEFGCISTHIVVVMHIQLHQHG